MSSTLTVASQLGVAVATGNFIGAALNLVSVFQGMGEQSPDQMILREIGQLRQEIDAFHQDMKARFDQVDRELNTIYSNVMIALNKIDIRLGKIQETVDHILSDVVEEQIKLDRIIRSLGAYFTNEYRQPLQIAINTDLGWPGDRPMSLEEYRRSRGVFYTFGRQNAYADPQESPVDNRSTDNFHLADELSGPMDQNIAFANHILATRGWLTFASDNTLERLPNPLTWSIAAAAYAQLEAEQPAIAGTADNRVDETAKKRDEVREGGRKLAQASEKLRAIMLPGPGSTDTPLLDTLLKNYTNAVLDWATEVDNSYHLWQENLRAQMKQQTDLHLWEGPDQNIGYIPPGLASSPGPAEGLNPPTNLRDIVPMPFFAKFFVADWLGHGKVSVTWTPELPFRHHCRSLRWCVDWFSLGLLLPPHDPLCSPN
ncbi:hypothetical protein KSB_67910 [Ktedonobacter robiniae]|uniref:Uncharacterized protein n=2 Tax=Ktedonobacter robiniae TaxID=2778365 RepID=A0ABQ3UZK8_9CHLR|nr:hypothetical protein KSB_67910 [Ktedonobacter robiniae]